MAIQSSISQFEFLFEQLSTIKLFQCFHIQMVVVSFLRNNPSAVMFFQRFIFSAKKFREKLFLRHLPNWPCSNFSRYVDLFQEISPRIAKQLRFQVKLHHLRRKCKNEVSDMARNMKIELLTFSLYCISRKTVDTEYTYYSWCMTSTNMIFQMKKNEWLWKFWKRNKKS
jgi:hypothetical protein